MKVHPDSHSDTSTAVKIKVIKSKEVGGNKFSITSKYRK